MEKDNLNFDIIGKRVRTYRKQAGMTQGKLAEKAGMDTNNVSRIERGISTPTLESLVKICNVLKVTPNDLLLESYNAPTVSLKIEISNLLEGLTNEEYCKIIDYIRFIKN